MKNTYDVIVVGAGPVGLWLSCELKLAGVDVAVIERRSERMEQSRALTIHGRSLEMFALRGLADRFLADGRPIPSGHYGVLETRLDFTHFETRFPYTLFLQQALTEQKLEEHALALGVDVLRGIAITGIADTGSEVRLTAATQTFTAAYVVGADGARSLVREQAGIAFEGLPAAHTLLLGDVVLDVPLPSPVVSAVNEHGCVMIAPLGDGVHHRIVLVDPLRTDVSRLDPVTLPELAEPTARIVGQDYRPRDPIWMTRFADETRLAAAYRKGRVLLAGDSAHIHMPAGGQGMNVGLQDAMNLGWKLAAVVKGKAPDALLDSYDEERRPVGQTLYYNTLAQTSLITRFDPPTLALREALNGLLTIPEANRRLAGELSGFDVAYGAEGKAALAQGLLAVGVRVPDATLTLPGGVSTGLHGLLDGGNWLHLAFENGAKTEGPEWLNPEAIRHVEAEPTKDIAAFSGIAALLVRPDGYAAAVVRN